MPTAAVDRRYRKTQNGRLCHTARLNLDDVRYQPCPVCGALPD